MFDEGTFKLPYHHIPPAMYDEVCKHLQEMVTLDTIRVSQSPYASPVVLIRKPNGQIRFCIDFRKLNSKTKRDGYALHCIMKCLIPSMAPAGSAALTLRAHTGR